MSRSQNAEVRQVTPPEGLPRLLADRLHVAAPATYAEHLATHGPLAVPSVRPGGNPDLVDLVEMSGLRGRGGAGFPTGLKMRAVAENGRRTVVVGNAAEGEPASSKDALLLTRAPHLVLDGLQLAAAAVGARDAYLYLHRGASSAYAAVLTAIEERRRARADRVSVEVVTTPDRYVSGEETALVNRVGGGLARPLPVPPRPYQKGVRGRPTLVQNVETLAHVALLARHGEAWFRSVGTDQDPGSALVTVTGAVARSGVTELALGTTLRELVAGLGGTTSAPRAVLLGGYYGSWLPAKEAWDLPLGHAALKARRSSFGAGIVVVLGEESCGLAESARVLRYLAEHGAQQCGPCLNGLPAIAGSFERLAGGRGRHELPQLQRWVKLVQGRGACSMPDGAARFADSAMQVFADEIRSHQRGPCPRCATQVLPTPRAPQPEDWR
jgi:NADH:ubiquinone oxidoreductase subunit F (NADH-binding)